ncbi:MAG: Kelch repeat-containing protein, partial [Thermomicrobiales bacterium]
PAPPTDQPASQGAWQPAGSMNIARAGHTATLLQDGRVLVVGGSDGEIEPPDRDPHTSAELYDPTTGAWQPAGKFAALRYGHTATLLQDGTVLAVGGFGNVARLTDCYDPKTNTWTPTSQLSTGRHFHTATLLSDGTVLVTGGIDDNQALASVERYDPATGAWRTVAPMSTPRAQHTATLLHDGTVLVVGGDASGMPLVGRGVASAERYDPRIDTWIPASSMGAARRGHTATLLTDGTVLVVDSSTRSANYDPITEAVRYDPTTDTWRRAGTFATRQWYHTATLLRDGTVLVTGHGQPGYLISAEIYDPAINSWSPAPRLPNKLESHTATLLNDGTVLVVGGFNWGAGRYLNSALRYVPAGALPATAPSPPATPAPTATPSPAMPTATSVAAPVGSPAPVISEPGVPNTGMGGTRQGTPGAGAAIMVAAALLLVVIGLGGYATARRRAGR